MAKKSGANEQTNVQRGGKPFLGPAAWDTPGLKSGVLQRERETNGHFVPPSLTKSAKTQRRG